jgi:hypothetical protein
MQAEARFGWPQIAGRHGLIWLIKPLGKDLSAIVTVFYLFSVTKVR